MNCEKLFYNDSFATTFTAEVMDCFENKDHFAIVLDKTLFYPEGGGQPCDHGVIRFNGETAEIFDVLQLPSRPRPSDHPYLCGCGF